MTDICTLAEEKSGGRVKPISQEELKKRRKQIREMADFMKDEFPLASAHLINWLDGATKDRQPIRRISSSEFNFSKNDAVIWHLEQVHRKRIAGGPGSGHEVVDDSRQITSKRDYYHGIHDRLQLPQRFDTDPNLQPLQPWGVERTITFSDSTRAQHIYQGQPTKPDEQDLAIALGGFTVASEVKVRAKKPRIENGETIQEVEVVSWKVQVCDSYDWNFQASAVMPPGVISKLQKYRKTLAPIAEALGLPFAKELQQDGLRLPPEFAKDLKIPDGLGSLEVSDDGSVILQINDNYMREVEAAGGAQKFQVFSEVFDAPKSVPKDFVFKDGFWVEDRLTSGQESQ
jgi:hypothetical protein